MKLLHATPAECEAMAAVHAEAFAKSWREDEFEDLLDGEGIYEVGSDIKAGKYKTEGGSDCYYAILNSTDTSDIADNGDVSGPAFVTVRDGQYLELSGCAEWTLQQ